MEERYLSLAEACEALGKSERTLYRWIKSGKLKAYKPGRDYEIPKSAIREMRERSEVYPKDLAPQLPLEPEPTEAERIEELRGFTKLLNGLGKRWTEETQENLAAGRYPFGWAIGISSAAIGLVGGMRDIPSIGGRDEIELNLSQEEQQAKLELSEAVKEMFRIADRASEVEESLEKNGEEVPESMISARKRHLAALRSIA